MQRSQRQRNAYSWVGDIDLLVPKFHRKIQAFCHIHKFTVDLFDENIVRRL
jgi:hypothetical protein